MANKSKEECKKALKICSSEDYVSCNECPYRDYSYYGKDYKGTNCDEEMMKDILEYLA